MRYILKPCSGHPVYDFFSPRLALSSTATIPLTRGGIRVVCQKNFCPFVAIIRNNLAAGCSLVYVYLLCTLHIRASVQVCRERTCEFSGRFVNTRHWPVIAKPRPMTCNLCTLKPIPGNTRPVGRIRPAERK